MKRIGWKLDVPVSYSNMEGRDRKKIGYGMKKIIRG
jgi:hypothetical protein